MGVNELGFERSSRRRPCVLLYSEGAGYNGKYTLDMIKLSFTDCMLLLLRALVLVDRTVPSDTGCAGRTRHCRHAWRRSTVAMLLYFVAHHLHVVLSV